MRILSYISLTPTELTKEGLTIEENYVNEDFDTFIRKIYKKLDVSYPKFFKMDELSKLAFMAGEALLRDFDKSEFESDKIGIVIGNNSSSIITDHKHYKSIESKEEYYPSPAVFVYTLPNIMIGELCIRHNIKGENSCFIFDNYDTEFFYNYICNLFENDGYEYLITGWVDFESENYEAYLFLISKEESNTGNPFDENYYKLIHKN